LATSAPLVAVELIAASIWVGGMVCLAIVAKAARGVLDESSQVAFFPCGRSPVQNGRHGITAHRHRCRPGALLATIVVVENH